MHLAKRGAGNKKGNPISEISFKILPRVGRMFSKDPAAYGYLADTIRAFPTARKLEEEMLRAGFARAWHLKLTSGIVCLHVGEKA